MDAEPALVYDFLYRARDWAQRLPHVSEIEVEESTTNLQTMRMVTRSPDGSDHTTHSVRVCFPATSIVYKQTAMPPVMSAHVGRWEVTPVGDGARVDSHHTVLIARERLSCQGRCRAWSPICRATCRSRLTRTVASSRFILGLPRKAAT